MKIQNIKSANIKFSGQEKVGQNIQPNQTVQQQELSTIKTLPAQFAAVNSPQAYTKLGEYEFLDGLKSHIYKLSNGQTVVLTPTKGELTINTHVRCGSINETDNIRGISHYIEHNLFNGSKNIEPKSFSKSLNQIGAHYNAGTWHQMTNYFITGCQSNEDNLKKIVEMHSDMLQNPLFNNEQLNKEKEIVNSEINMYASMPDSKIMNKAIMQLFQIKSKSEDLVAGSVDTINNLTKDDVVKYYNENYTPDKMMTFLTGEFEPDKAIDLISKNFTKQLKQTNQTQTHETLNPIEKSVRSDFYMPNTDVARFTMALKGPENSNLKEQLCARMILDMLANNDYPMLKEPMEKYNAKVSGDYDQIGNKKDSPSVLMFSGSCKDKDTEDVLKTIYENIYNFKNKDIQSELESAKKYNTKMLLKTAESGYDVNDYLRVNLSTYSIDDVKNMPAVINSITVDDINKTFDKYFNLNKVSISVAHPQKELEKVSFKGRLENNGLDLNEFKYAKLSNNTQLYLKEDSSKLKDFKLIMKTPEPANVNPMLPIVLEQLLLKGSANESEKQFLKTLSKNSIDLDIKVSNSAISIKGNALNKDVEFGVNKTVELLNHPKFNQKDFDEVKKQLQFNISEKTKSPFDVVENVMLPQQKSTASKEEALKALNDLKLSDVMGFMQYMRMNGENYFIWNKKEIPNSLVYLGTFKEPNNAKFRTYQPLENDVIKTQIDDTKQAKIVQAYKFEYSDTPSFDANVVLLNNILGETSSSRLFTDLRETQKLAYKVNSGIEKNGNTGVITLAIGTTTDNPEDKNATSENINKSLKGFDKNIEKLKNEPVSDTELQKAKTILKTNIKNSCNTNSGKMGCFLKNVCDHNDPNYINNLLNEIDNVSPQSIQETAQKIFAGHKLISVVASEKTLKEVNLLQK